MEELTLAVLSASPLPLEFSYGAAFPAPRLAVADKISCWERASSESSLEGHMRPDVHYEDIKWKCFRDVTVP